MASNELPKGNDALFTLAQDMADGLHTYEGAIGIKQNLEVDFRVNLVAAEAAVADYDTSRATKTALGTNQTVADSNGKGYLGSARAVLALRLGGDWSDAWLPTGFPNQSTAVPGTLGERQVLLYAQNLYFLANPGFENNPLGVTATNALALADTLSTTRSAVNDAATVCGQKKHARDLAVAALRKRMRGLITELEQLLEDDDPRWNAFGLNMPGADNTPDIPDAPVLTPGTPGVVNLNWVAAPRADHYRVFQQVVGVDADFVFVDSPHDTNLTVNSLTTGATVKFCLSAVNDAGESQKSDAAQIVVP